MAGTGPGHGAGGGAPPGLGGTTTQLDGSVGPHAHATHALGVAAPAVPAAPPPAPVPPLAVGAPAAPPIVPHPAPPHGPVSTSSTTVSAPPPLSLGANSAIAPIATSSAAANATVSAAALRDVLQRVTYLERMVARCPCAQNNSSRVGSNQTSVQSGGGGTNDDNSGDTEMKSADTGRSDGNSIFSILGSSGGLAAGLSQVTHLSNLNGFQIPVADYNAPDTATAYGLKGGYFSNVGYNYNTVQCGPAPPKVVNRVSISVPYYSYHVGGSPLFVIPEYVYQLGSMNEEYQCDMSNVMKKCGFLSSGGINTFLTWRPRGGEGCLVSYLVSPTLKSECRAGVVCGTEATVGSFTYLESLGAVARFLNDMYQAPESTQFSLESLHGIYDVTVKGPEIALEFGASIKSKRGNLYIIETGGYSALLIDAIASNEMIDTLSKVYENKDFDEYKFGAVSAFDEHGALATMLPGGAIASGMNLDACVAVLLFKHEQDRKVNVVADNGVTAAIVKKPILGGTKRIRVTFEVRMTGMGTKICELSDCYDQSAGWANRWNEREYLKLSERQANVSNVPNVPIVPKAEDPEQGDGAKDEAQSVSAASGGGDEKEA